MTDTVLEDGSIWRWILTCHVQGLVTLLSDRVRHAEPLGDIAPLLVPHCTQSLPCAV